MNAVVDIGNSRVKTGLFKGEDCLQVETFKETKECIAFLNEKNIDAVIISSVRNNIRTERGSLSANNILELNYDTPLPLAIQYDTPTTLGMDRIAAACGGWSIFPKQRILIIDIGTCITYDLVDETGTFQGGAISPGMCMRYEAMHTFTDRLPKPPDLLPDRADWVGKSTDACIKSGVINGISSELKGFIDHFSQKYSDITTILCGGDHEIFIKQLQFSVVSAPNLVLKGLNAILSHNVS